MSRPSPRPLAHRDGERVRLHDLHPTPADLRDEVLRGLSQPQKSLPPKLFYDRRGSLLFDAITELPEYYPTRTEIAILREQGAAMAERLGRGRVLVELGSGSSVKIQTLLAVLEPAVYVPVDISKEHLLASARALAERFPRLLIHAVCADYSGPVELPLEPDWGPGIAFFPGSSIGNFDPPQARALLGRIAALVGSGGRLLIGVDLKKDQARLEAAYNDAQGVTAEFNRNLLVRLNRELGADFDLDAFAHRAFYDPAPDPGSAGGPGRIEMHLVSRIEQSVRVGGERFYFRAGETIHTESSYKYDRAGFGVLAASAGYETEAVWTDPEGLFSVHCLRVAASAEP
ncbi:MAG: L-histidine N(alpha)-methyltransferase [Chromatiaceae bacterium]|jgi:dimethylhistidine N-methyltransferase|nr:L-histidine N(alpha)-methyltransferase [Chromatiaceae bacterium]